MEKETLPKLPMVFLQLNDFLLTASQGDFGTFEQNAGIYTKMVEAYEKDKIAFYT